MTLSIAYEHINLRNRLGRSPFLFSAAVSDGLTSSGASAIVRSFKRDINTSTPSLPGTGAFIYTRSFGSIALLFRAWRLNRGSATDSLLRSREGEITKLSRWTPDYLLAARTTSSAL